MDRLLILCILVLLPLAPPTGAQTPSGELRLRPGDAVRLAVSDEPTLSGDFPVVESGRVLLPEIGLVAVAGRPFGEVEREVRDGYRRIVVDREVVLVPLVRVAVLGEVRQPGLFPVDPTETVADVLARAGGITPTGNPRRVALVRDGRTTRVRLTPSAPALAERLRSGDQIIVGQRGWLRENLPVVVGAGTSVLAATITSLIIRSNEPE
ncbi:MAG TPA: polysaccharide biosynthesis/export family protein [Longimicrobiaceae bacterium]|nr:polysaccharide biosynthesis/export family protein [Longimicrobiaceae bacterium]